LADEPGLSPEQLLERLTVSDLLLGTLASLVQLGYAKLGAGKPEQARLAIEALRALVPVLEDAAPPEALRDLRQATANLQLAYADSLNAPSGEETAENVETAERAEKTTETEETEEET
jgi:hypothetical protein